MKINQHTFDLNVRVFDASMRKPYLAAITSDKT